MKNAAQVFSLVGLTNLSLDRASLGDLMREIRPQKPESGCPRSKTAWRGSARFVQMY